MKRKDFLSQLVPLGAVMAGTVPQLGWTEPGKIQVPPHLKKGDLIGITCPSGNISLADVQPAIQRLTEWGFTVKVGDTVGKKDFSLGGTDEERIKDLQQLLDDPAVKAILCARGGYGSIRIIDNLNFKLFNRKPKWVIGFSDATVLHSHLHQQWNVASLHSKMCNSFPEDWNKAEPDQISSLEGIRDCLLGKKMGYTFPVNPNNKTGIATGQLVGGNLKILETLSGTKSDINTAGKILFVEDTHEYRYSIDRMFWNLKRTGKLQQLAGLIIGGFKLKKDDEGEEFGKTLEAIVLEKVQEYQYPVCFDFPVGHQKNNQPLKCGLQHHLSVHLNECLLKEA